MNINQLHEVRTPGEFTYRCIQAAIHFFGGYGATMDYLERLQREGLLERREKSDIKKLINRAFEAIEEAENVRLLGEEGEE